MDSAEYKTKAFETVSDNVLCKILTAACIVIPLSFVKLLPCPFLAFIDVVLVPP